MQSCVANNESCAVRANIFSLVSDLRGKPQQHAQKSTELAPVRGTEPVITLAAVVGNEFSRVGEVETVFLECDQESGKAYRVVTVIGERSPDIRAQVYLKEQAVMNTFPGVNFSFRVISRAGRNLSEVMDGVGRLVYQKG